MKKIQVLLICSALILSFWEGLVYASDELAKEIILYAGQIKIFSVNMPTRIVVGKPEVADVTVATEKEITVTAKSPGTTTFVVWDNFGEQHFTIRVFSEDMRETKNRIDSLIKNLNLPKVYTKAVDSENKVLLLGEVKTSQDIERINVALSLLREKTVNLIQVKEEEAVVGIDVQVLELDKDATQTLGFTWPGSITLTETGSPGIASAGTKWSTLFKVLNLSRAAFSWTLDLLVQEGKARVLSQPRLSCQSGKEAELLVGGEKPILTTQIVFGGSGTNVEYKEFGIKLKIKPTVTEDKKIKLALNVEVSEVGTAETLGSATIITAKAYPLSKRNASTELFLNDGQTMAIGGLKKQKSEEDIRKTPFLGDVPILGLFFRKKTTKAGQGQGERGDVDLFITLTPTIIKEGVKKEEVKPEAAPPAKEKITAKGRIKEPTTAIKEGVKKEEKPTDPLQNYISSVRKRIVDNLSYPILAKEAGFQGTVKLNLHLSWRGKPLGVVIKESSGYKILDENALSAARGIVSYPPFPPSMDQKELRVEIPIAYRLD